MGRIFWGGAVALVLVANPTVRERAKPYVQPALDPVYEWSTRSRVHEVSRLIQARAAGGRPLPTPRTFSSFLEEEFHREEEALDAWGTPYYLKAGRREVLVGSAGRDRTVGTEDDIVAPVEVRRR